MPPIPQVMEILNKIAEIHKKKNEDYAGPNAAFENFERSALLISWFKHDADKTFVNQIGTKLARLATLLNSERAPNNESIADSFLDLATYVILWSAHHDVKFNPRPIDYSAVEEATIRRSVNLEEQ